MRWRRVRWRRVRVSGAVRERSRGGKKGLRCGEEGGEVGAQRSGNGPTRKPAALASLASRALTLPPTSTSSDPDETQYARSPSSPSFSTSVEAAKLAGTIESATRPRVSSSLPSKGARREIVEMMRFFCASSGRRASGSVAASSAEGFGKCSSRFALEPAASLCTPWMR